MEKKLSKPVVAFLSILVFVLSMTLVGMIVYLENEIKKEEKATAAEIEKMLDLMEEACKQQKEIQRNQLNYGENSI